MEQGLRQHKTKHPAGPEMLYHSPESLSRLVVQPVLSASASLERFEGRIAKDDACFAHGTFQPIAREHVGFRQGPAIRVGHVGQRQRQTGNFERKGVTLHSVQSMTQVGLARFAPVGRQQLAQQAHR